MTDPKSHHRRCLRSVIAVTVVLVAGLSAKPGVATEQEFQQWSSVTFRYDFSDRVTGSFSPRLRFDEDLERIRDLTLRPSVAIGLADRITLGLGYSYTKGIASGINDENRPWQSITFRTPIDELSMSHRFRLEERITENSSGVSLRSRYRLAVSHPVINESWYVAGTEEVFVALNSSGGRDSGFDQNRLSVGLGHLFTPRMGAELGYMWNYKDRSGADLSAHVVTFNFTFRTGNRN